MAHFFNCLVFDTDVVINNSTRSQGSAADCKKDYTLPYKAGHKIIGLANKPITIKLAMYFFGCLELTMFRFNVDYVLRQL